MAGSRLYDNPTIYPLFTLLDEIRQGLISVPRFQRPFVWKEEQRLDLLDSVRRGMPMGSILVWRTRKHKLKTLTNLGGWSVEPAPEFGPWTYLIDGHQRVMTLLSALYPPDESAYNAQPEEGRVPYPIYYDLQQEVFTFHRGRGKLSTTLMPVETLRSNKATFEFCRPLYAEGLTTEAERAEALRNRFTEYWIPVIPVVTEEFMTVTLGFQRINRGNTPMGEVHMLHAVLAAYNVDLLEQLDEARSQHLERLRHDWKTLDDEYLLAAIKLSFGIGIYSKDVETLAKHIAGNPVCIGQAAKQVALAVKWLRDNCGVHTLKQHLPYAYQLVLLSMAFTPEGVVQWEKNPEPLCEWFWRTSLLETFAGISEGRLNQVTRELREMLAGNPTDWTQSLNGSFERLVSPKRESARLRALRSLYVSERKDRDRPTKAFDDALGRWKKDPQHPPEEIANLERDMAERFGVELRRGGRSREDAGPESQAQTRVPALRFQHRPWAAKAKLKAR